MLISAQIETDSGAIASVWDIVSINISYPNKVAIIVVSGYLDQASKDAGKSSLQQKQFIAAAEDFDSNFSDAVLSSKSILSATSQFLLVQDQFSKASAVVVADPITPEPPVVVGS